MNIDFFFKHWIYAKKTWRYKFKFSINDNYYAKINLCKFVWYVNLLYMLYPPNLLCISILLMNDLNINVYPEYATKYLLNQYKIYNIFSILVK